jgi:hypothetical protein
MGEGKASSAAPAPRAAPSRESGRIVPRGGATGTRRLAPDPDASRIVQGSRADCVAGVAELADATDLKSVGTCVPCGFKSHPRHYFLSLL